MSFKTLISTILKNLQGFRYFAFNNRTLGRWVQCHQKEWRKNYKRDTAHVLSIRNCYVKRKILPWEGYSGWYSLEGENKLHQGYITQHNHIPCFISNLAVIFLLLLPTEAYDQNRFPTNTFWISWPIFNILK